MAAIPLFHLGGESANEVSSDEEGTDPGWAKHPARAVLKAGFEDGTIPLDYSKTIRPRGVFDMFEDHPAFANMPYGDTFTRRLRDLRKQVGGRVDRAAEDQLAFDTFRKNTPKKTHNSKGEPRWEGSDAELWLKQDVADGLHKGVKPKDLHQTRQAYLEFGLKVFRGHINQEVRLRKLHNYLEDKGKAAMSEPRSDNDASDDSSESNE
ncbi:hypothetical protein SEMRO_3138_G344350.1 [Seminavis robusta]|uniref:Uncharacterized protein n=1 Tax=Seminavis robusta TaxID=568900 RepID=A0A9N8F3X3_9STRA|nr:hypothetical protein SEMRO_3138_G344350.1 [Seminavis robusta]|eukprot:Sro3138_g344350.1 n/a (208) ;mRNA; r:1996-2619